MTSNIRRKRVYIAHPLGSGTDRHHNRIRAELWVIWAAEIGYAPIADWIIISGMWTEDRRDEGMDIDFTLIEACSILFLVGGRISPGMAEERDYALARGIKVVDLTYLGEVPPHHDSEQSGLAIKFIERAAA